MAHCVRTLRGCYVIWGDVVSEFSGDVREVQFLYRLISVVVQRFNTVLLHDLF